MKLPKWVLLFVILLAGMAQLSNQVHANSINKALASNTASMAGTEASTVASKSLSVNLNSANAEQLSSLPGVGIKKAEAIIAYRELNGEFESIEELVNVKGIGPKVLAKLNGLITV